MDTPPRYIKIVIKQGKETKIFNTAFNLTK